MPTVEPVEGRCSRCQQTRPVFMYKPLHDCVAEIGSVNLVDAATHLWWFEEYGDRWCRAQVGRMLHRVCVPCHDKETVDEQEFIDEWLTD